MAKKVFNKRIRMVKNKLRRRALYTIRRKDVKDRLEKAAKKKCCK